MPDRCGIVDPFTSTCCPCNAGCPAGENIQAWLGLARVGDHERAWRQLVTDNPFAAIHGRVCYHPCESVCNRAQLDSAVSIHAVERFLGDAAREQGWAFAPPTETSGKRVLVIGAGPSGLSAAYHLSRLGHHVEIRDAGDEPGGMMRYGIPNYRLPRDVLDAEVQRIASLGVELTCGHRVEDLDAERRDGNFDAVFVAVGAHLAKRVDIPTQDAGSLLDAASFLRTVASGVRPDIGRHVAVFGAGDTAMDAARVARRLGADDTVIIYRRTRAQMAAHEEEAQQAEREGIEMHWLRTITAFERPEIQVGRNVNVLVLVLDTEVYSNTGGQMSKSTPLAAVAKFAATGKTVPKKDLALQAIAYGNVYVARVTMGADPRPCRPSAKPSPTTDRRSCIAYSHCIAHGIDMRQGLDQQYRAVASGHWPLVRYDPVVRATGDGPFMLDSHRPRISLTDYRYSELRYRSLANSDPDEADRLLALAQQAVDQRWDTYENMASRGPQHFPSDARKDR